jgi:hypothetical protein
LVRHRSSAQGSSNLAVIVNRRERVTDLVVFFTLRTTRIVLRLREPPPPAGVWPSFAMTCGDNVAADDFMKLYRTPVIGALTLGALVLLGLWLRCGKFSG